MATIRTWWGQRFMEALEQFTDSARLQRGRAYARNGRIEEWKLEQNDIVARVRGNANSYFGVYETPYYKTRIGLQPIAEKDWQILIQQIGNQAAFVSRLLLKEMPDNIEGPFQALNLRLLPYSAKDMRTQCSCPDYSNPCKHLAGLCYVLAEQLDHDPFLLFELRGIPRDRLFEQLQATPLGKVLVIALAEEKSLPDAALSYYPRPIPRPQPTSADPYAFWQGARHLPTELLPLTPAPSIPAAILKKGSEYPEFWSGATSFIDVMEQVYGTIRKKPKEW